jgi:hypothetical protein
VYRYEYIVSIETPFDVTFGKVTMEFIEKIVHYLSPETVVTLLTCSRNVAASVTMEELVDYFLEAVDNVCGVGVFDEDDPRFIQYFMIFSQVQDEPILHKIITQMEKKGKVDTKGFLLLSCSYGYETIARKMLSLGANVDMDDGLLIILATKNDHLRVIHELLEWGYKLKHYVNYELGEALWRSIGKGHVSIVEELLRCL